MSAANSDLPTARTGSVGISRRGLIGATLVIALGNVLSRGLGLVRDQVIAATFGATAQTDAYFVARIVPLILYDLLVGSVITAAFVPVFVQFANDERQLWRLVGAIFSLAAIGLTVIAVALAVFARPVVDALTGFSAVQQDLATQLMRVALLSVVFQGLAGVLASVHYAQNRFTLPAFANATFNAGIILGVLALARSLGIEAAAVGLVLGAVGQLLLQAVGLRRFWRAYRPRIDLREPAVRRILVLGGTVAAGLAVTVLGQLIDTNLATRLSEGNLASKQYATTLIQFPLGLVGIAASYAVLPTLSRFASGPDKDPELYRSTLLFGLKLVLLLMLPALAGLLAVAHPLVALLFERGAFHAADTDLTAGIILAFAPMLPLTGIDYLLINAFYARQNARTPVVVGVASVGLYLVMAAILIQPLGIIGLAVANAIQNSAHGLVLLVILSRTLPDLRLGRELGGFLARVVPASAAMGAAVWASLPLLGQLPPLVALAVATGLGAILYAGLLLVLGVPEARQALRIPTARFRR